MRPAAHAHLAAGALGVVDEEQIRVPRRAHKPHGVAAAEAVERLPGCVVGGSGRVAVIDQLLDFGRLR